MDLKTALYALADIFMIIAGFTYGFKFIRNYQNYLLGLEWIIVASSGTNFLVYGLVGANESSPMFHAAFFLDAFSRSIGITVILVLGLMKVTHGYKPSVAVDIGVFGLAIIGGLVMSLFAEARRRRGHLLHGDECPDDAVPVLLRLATVADRRTR